MDNADGPGYLNPALRSTLTVCRGCCCGTLKKHPDLDHEEQVDRLRAAAGADRVRVVTECLGACDQSNVVVVVPSPIGRIFGGRPAWIGGVLDDVIENELVNWISGGGPGTAAPSAALRAMTFHRPTTHS